MNIPKEKRKHLCDLSQQLYGSLYRWQKIMEQGEWLGVLDEDGVAKNILVQPTIETIEEYMRNRIKQTDRQILEYNELLKEEKRIADGEVEDQG